MITKSYGKLVVEAEAVVANVTDPELKKIAYGKILDRLLEGSPAVTEAQTAKSKSPKTKSEPKAKLTSGPQAYIQRMVDDGFFVKPKTMAEVRLELENRGHHIPLTSLSGPLQNLTQRQILRRQRLKAEGKKKGNFAYSNW